MPASTRLKVGLDVTLRGLLALEPDWGDHDTIVAELTKIFLDAFKAGAPDVPVDGAMRDLAAEFAKERTSGLIEDLTGTTRDDIQQLVAEAVQHGQSIGWLRDAIRGEACFGKARAETIAITETAYALGRGQHAAAVVMQQDEKSWVAEATACEICAANADQGWLGIDETYSSGDSGIPGHTRCRCTEIYRTSRVHAAVLPVLVREAHCPVCRRWVGRNVNAGAECYCPKHGGVLITA